MMISCKNPPAAQTAAPEAALPLTHVLRSILRHRMPSLQVTGQGPHLGTTVRVLGDTPPPLTPFPASCLRIRVWLQACVARPSFPTQKDIRTEQPLMSAMQALISLFRAFLVNHYADLVLDPYLSSEPPPFAYQLPACTSNTSNKLHTPNNPSHCSSPHLRPLLWG